MCIAFRNIFCNDFSTRNSSYRFNLTHFIFKGTTIINIKLTLGVWLWLRWKLTLPIVLMDVVNLVRVLLKSFMACEF